MQVTVPELEEAAADGIKLQAASFCPSLHLKWMYVQKWHACFALGKCPDMWQGAWQKRQKGRSDQLEVTWPNFAHPLVSQEPGKKRPPERKTLNAGPDP